MNTCMLPTNFIPLNQNLTNPLRCPHLPLFLLGVKKWARRLPIAIDQGLSKSPIKFHRRPTRLAHNSFYINGDLKCIYHYPFMRVIKHELVKLFKNFKPFVVRISVSITVTMEFRCHEADGWICNISTKVVLSLFLSTITFMFFKPFLLYFLLGIFIFFGI